MPAQVHADSIMTRPPLLAAAARLQRKLRPTWLRLDELLHSVRCVTDFVANVQ